MVNLAALARIDPERVEEGNKAFGENPISDHDEVSTAIAGAGTGAAEIDAGIRFYRCRAVGGIQPFAKITHESARSSRPEDEKESTTSIFPTIWS